MPVRIYTTFDDPLAPTGGTQAWGINASGQLVGSYSAGGNIHGFLDTNGTYTAVASEN